MLQERYCGHLLLLDDGTAVYCWQLNAVGVKPTSGEQSNKPLTDKRHQTNGPASKVSHSHFSAQPQPATVASDANISTLSLLSVGPYEEFAVSIILCVGHFLPHFAHIFINSLFVSFCQSTFCTILSLLFLCEVATVMACRDFFICLFYHLTPIFSYFSF